MLRTLLFLREAYVGRVAPKGWGSFTQSIIQPHVAAFQERNVQFFTAFRSSFSLPAFMGAE